MYIGLPLASAAPPPPPPFETLGNAGDGRAAAAPSSSYIPSVMIIISVVAFVIVASAGIRLLLRYISRRREARNHIIFSSTSSSSSSSSATSAAPFNRERKSQIDSLPLFTLASSLSSVPNSSADCAVCLSPIRLDDELRLLPACRHAFHSPCIDTWLESTASCPLCRSSVSFAAPPAPEDRSDSFRIEIGSVSRRRTSISADDDSSDAPSSPSSHVLSMSYSLGSSFEFLVDGEVEAVVARVTRTESKDEDEDVATASPPPPGAELADAAGDGGSGWLKDYVDRLVSSASSSFRHSGRWIHRSDASSSSSVAADTDASSSFRHSARRIRSSSAPSSFRHSGRRSHRYDAEAAAAAAIEAEAAYGGGLQWWYSGETEVQEEEEGFLGSFFRWLMGA